MITKQQAMDFIYNLSQITDVKLDLSKGILAAEEDSRKSGFYHYKVGMCKCSLEELVMFFIKGYLDSALLSNIPIPVDMSMLEVGKTYKMKVGVVYQKGRLMEITEDKLIFSFLKSDIIFGIDKQDINEIYEVQNDN